MSKPSWIIAVVEDQHQKMLVYRYLLHCGLKPHEIEVRASPAAKGSADHWVLEEFVRQIDAYRDRQRRARTALIVAIDADALAVQDRIDQLDEALRQNGKPAVGDAEQIARLVPKRNVETWILVLNNVTDVNEHADYKPENRKWHKLIRTAAETLCQWTGANVDPPPWCVDSLRSGIRELKRLRA